MGMQVVLFWSEVKQLKLWKLKCKPKNKNRNNDKYTIHIVRCTLHEFGSAPPPFLVKKLQFGTLVIQFLKQVNTVVFELSEFS